MANWWDQMGTSIGDNLIGMQIPFGMSPPTDPQQRAAMINPMLIQMGAGILAGKDRNPAVNIGRGVMAGQQFGAENMGRQLYAQQIGMANDKRKKDEERENQTIEWLKKNHPELYYPGMSGEDAGKVFQSTLKPPDMPASVDEYNFAKQNGYTGSFTDFKTLGSGSGANDYMAQVEQRKAVAQQLGIGPEHPAYQAFIATGKMPREDAQNLTAGDKKAIREGDEMVMTSKGVEDQLKRAIALNDTTNWGSTATTQAWAARNDPTGFFDDAKGAQTTEFQNLVGTQALNNMKAIFGANPTEGERAILMELQASVDKSPTERKPILDRALKLVQMRIKFYQDQATDLRGNDYYSPNRGAETGPSGGQVEDPLGIR